MDGIHLMTIEMERLKITNYDNFKDSSVFINEHFEAERRMEEIRRFFQSFYMSKLIKSEDICKLSPSFISFGEYDVLGSWFKEIAGSDIYLYGQCMSTYRDKKRSAKCLAAERKERSDEIKHEISKFLRNKWSCYYVLDKDNILHEFVPVSAADTIEVEFDKQSIYIRGHYYYGCISRGDFGKVTESVCKIVKTVVIDPSNNNVIRVESQHICRPTQMSSVKLSHGEVKSHAWSRDLDTFSFVNPYDAMREYIKEKYASWNDGYERIVYSRKGHCHRQAPICVARDKAELSKIHKDIIKAHKALFKDTFGETLSLSDLKRYEPLIWLRDDAIKECFKDWPEEFEYEPIDNVSEDKFPIVQWRKLSTNRDIMQEE